MSYGGVRHRAGLGQEASGPGLFSLDFADTDIRAAVAQILGFMLRLNYPIDPAVKGTVTLRTAHQLTAARLLPALQTILGGVGAVPVQSEDLYRVAPATTAGSAGSVILAPGVKAGHRAMTDRRRRVSMFRRAGIIPTRVEVDSRS